MSVNGEHMALIESDKKGTHNGLLARVHASYHMA